MTSNNISDNYYSVARLELLAKEKEYLEEFLLRRYFSERNADQIANRLFEIAIELDEIVDHLRDDPDVNNLYRYDGKFFTHKNNGAWHRCYDGLNFLKILDDDNLKAFFTVEPERAKFRLMEWLEDNNLRLALTRVRQLYESGTIALLTPAQIADFAKQADSSIPDSFFEPHERQMLE